MNIPLKVMKYRSTIEAHSFAFGYTINNAPDNRSRTNSRRELHACYENSEDIVEFFYLMSGTFEELRDMAHHKHHHANTIVIADKWAARENFYETLRHWADACMKEHQSLLPDTPAPAKDAEDDSDPYVPTPKPKQNTIGWARARLTSDLYDANFTSTQVDAALKTFDHEANYFLSDTVTVCDILERVGDNAAQVSYVMPRDDIDTISFWDAVVLITDNLRAEITNRICLEDEEPAPAPIATPRNEVCYSSDPENAGQMWEITGDPHRALFTSKQDAEKWARELFPNEYAGRRSARVQYRTILKYPA